MERLTPLAEKPVAIVVETCMMVYMSTAAATTAPATFKVGNTYSARSVCDHNCVWTFKVSKRTAKFVTFVDELTGDTYRRGVHVWDGAEWARPFGDYSMAPTLYAGER